MIGLVVLFSLSAMAQDNTWKKETKDDFDIAVEKANKGVKPAFEDSEPEPVEAVPQVESAPEIKTYKDLKSTPVKLSDGGKVKFEKVVIFSCENIAKKRFMFNKKQSNQCWIKDVKDAALIAEKIGIEEFKKKASVFEICPEKMASEKACDPKKLRNF